MLKSKMTDLVKGAGFVGNGNAPISDPGIVTTKAHQATMELRAETHRGYTNRASVVKSMDQGFLNQFGNLKTALTMPSVGEQISQLVGGMPGGADALKSFTAGNLGIGTVSGLVPFDLLAPSRLIYPVYTVFRNKLPRPAGQGTSRIERVFTGISGSQTGGQGVKDISIPELVQSNGTLASTSWPLNLPGAGSQTEVQLNVPYKFFGLTESLSWLAQFAGQGFEDISALANLILLQEMMLGEEYQMIAASSSTLSAPTIVSTTARAAGSNETTVGVNANFTVFVTATNYYGETTAATGSCAAVQRLRLHERLADHRERVPADLRCRWHQVHHPGRAPHLGSGPAGHGHRYGFQHPYGGHHPDPGGQVRHVGRVPRQLEGRLLQR
jgi:hypothetical protein